MFGRNKVEELTIRLFGKGGKDCLNLQDSWNGCYEDGRRYRSAGYTEVEEVGIVGNVLGRMITKINRLEVRIAELENKATKKRK